VDNASFAVLIHPHADLLEQRLLHSSCQYLPTLVQLGCCNLCVATTPCWEQMKQQLATSAEQSPNTGGVHHHLIAENTTERHDGSCHSARHMGITGTPP